jgi:hypothetical protein
MTDSKSAENDALADALAWLDEIAPKDDRLYEVDFGRFADGVSGCWWSMKLVTEVRNGEVKPSPEDAGKKRLAVIQAWRKAYLE